MSTLIKIHFSYSMQRLLTNVPGGGMSMTPVWGLSLRGSGPWQPVDSPQTQAGRCLPLEAFRSIFGEFGYFTMTKTLITWNCGSNNMSRRGRRDPTCNYHIQKGLKNYTEVGLKIVKLCLKPFPPNTVFKFCVGWIPHFWRRHGKPSPEPLEMDL